MLPAYAGMILLRRQHLRRLHSAPRVCGDDPVDRLETYFTVACSPRMRG